MSSYFILFLANLRNGQIHGNFSLTSVLTDNTKLSPQVYVLNSLFSPSLPLIYLSWIS